MRPCSETLPFNINVGFLGDKESRDNFSPRPVSVSPSPAAAVGPCLAFLLRGKTGSSFLCPSPEGGENSAVMFGLTDSGPARTGCPHATPPASGKARGLLQFTGELGRHPCLKCSRKVKSGHRLEPPQWAVCVPGQERKGRASSFLLQTQ